MSFKNAQYMLSMVIDNINRAMEGEIMPPIVENTNMRARSLIEKEKVFTLKQLVSALGCSPRTAQTRIKQWNAHTSYNMNGKYYTLPEIPEFDDNGIWRYRKAAFSRHGNMKQTIIYLITTSFAGLNGRQLGDILGLDPRSFLHHFRQVPGIQREKHCGVYVYFSDEPEIYKTQMIKRQELTCRSLTETISDLEAILILVAIIRQHDISAEEIFRLPEVKNSNITLPALRGFLEHHGLVKKMPDTGR